MTRWWIPLGAALAAMAVVAGTWSAHGLDSFLELKHDDVDLIARRMGNWNTAVLYEMHHAIGMILVGLVALHRPNRLLHVAGWCFLLGITLFAGMLQVLVLTETTALGSIVPIGGASLIVGWGAFAIGAYTASNPNPDSQ